MPRIIDAYTHILTEQFYEELRREHGFQGLSGSPEFLWDVEKRLTDMDEYGIDRQVITLALPPVWRGMSRENALSLTAFANDEVRRLADDHPEFIPVGTVPFGDGEFVEEFHRCIEDLDMAGVQIFSNVEGRPIDGPAMRPLYRAVAEQDVPLWLHPQLFEWYDWADEYMDHRLFGWPFDTTLALSRLVFSGIMDEHDLDLISHHGGGMVPFYGARIEMFYEQRMEYPENYPGIEWAEYSKPIGEYFSSFHADTAVSGSTAALDCAERFFEDGNVVFGTDYPFSPERGRKAVRTTVEAVEEMAVDEETKGDIFAANLESLIE